MFKVLSAELTQQQKQRNYDVGDTVMFPVNVAKLCSSRQKEKYKI